MRSRLHDTFTVSAFQQSIVLYGLEIMYSTGIPERTLLIKIWVLNHPDVKQGRGYPTREFNMRSGIAFAVYTCHTIHAASTSTVLPACVRILQPNARISSGCASEAVASESTSLKYTHGADWSCLDVG